MPTPNATESTQAPADDPADKPVPGPEAPPVVLLHGLGVIPQFMELIAWRLRRRGRVVYNIGYNSYHTPIPDIAVRVSRRIMALDHPEVDAVVHSMGGIVLRWAANHCPMPKLRRVVMLGTPNLGSVLADRLESRLRGLPSMLFGEAFLQLRRGDNGLCTRAGRIAGAEVGVVAGGLRKQFGMSKLIPGDNDTKVAVEETVMPGMTDFIVVPERHGYLLLSNRTFNHVHRYLETGRFREAATAKATSV